MFIFAPAQKYIYFHPKQDYPKTLHHPSQCQPPPKSPFPAVRISFIPATQKNQPPRPPFFQFHFLALPNYKVIRGGIDNNYYSASCNWVCVRVELTNVTCCKVDCEYGGCDENCNVVVVVSLLKEINQYIITNKVIKLETIHYSLKAII